VTVTIKNPEAYPLSDYPRAVGYQAPALRELELQLEHMALSERVGRLEAALEHVDQGILMVDARGYVVVCNQRTIELLGLPPEMMRLGPHFEDVKKWQSEQGEFAEADPALLYAIQHEGIHVAASVYERRRPNGTVLDIRTKTLPDGGVVRTYTDITMRRFAEKEMWRSANHDALTGLANRSLFNSSLEKALVQAEASGSGVGLLLLDLDDFKNVNDSLGHEAGDKLLSETAARLSGLAAKGDTVARIGGDEFALICREYSSLCALWAFADQVVAALQAPFEYEGRMHSTAASIGVAAFPEHHREPAELVKDADIALYRAKEQGRSRAVVYTNAAREVTEQRVTIIQGVRKGLAEGEFLPHYQPKVSLATGQITGFEALARWQHRTKGLLTPAYFGSAFEDSSLSVSLGADIIQQVARDIRAWLDQGLSIGRVAVNLASADFADDRLATRIIDILDDARVPTSNFEVEITETVFLSRKTDAAAIILSEFHEAGVSIALDDFGTGFASLTHLKQFPVDHIKIDQSFIRNLENDEDDAAIVSAVVSLGRNMGMHVTAEGVENAGQVKRLREAGCDFGQGYLYAKPSPGLDVPDLIKNWAPPEEVGLRHSEKRLFQNNRQPSLR
jgi:diguanylate cyclase (GGDEF)-like protein